MTKSIKRNAELGELSQIGKLIDDGADSRRSELTTSAMSLLDEFQVKLRDKSLEPIVHYFRANCWENRKHERADRDLWDWDQPEAQAQILELHYAIRHKHFSKTQDLVRCQILTNLANNYSFIGRTIEASALWSRALEILPNFGMALGNRGAGFCTYSDLVYDEGHASVLLAEAQAHLHQAISSTAFFESDGYAHVIEEYRLRLEKIESYFDAEAVRSSVNLDGYSLGNSEEEVRYRRWCLQNKLFINPLNDVGPFSVAASDVMHLPSIVTRTACPPWTHGFFNQIKQEYVSARFMYYNSSLNIGHPGQYHFSDSEVLLLDTLNYPAFGFDYEQMKFAYRAAYSLFDKIAFFINEYFSINHSPERVSFRSVWYTKANANTPLHPSFTSAENLPLRGLYWLSKDFFEESFRTATLPEAEALLTIRNHLEHRYLSLHYHWGIPERLFDEDRAAAKHVISETTFADRTLELLKRARAGIIYLSLAVHSEERRRTRSEETNGFSMPMSLPPIVR